MNTIMKTSMIIWFILSATIKMNAQYSDVHCKQHPQSMQITQIDYSCLLYTSPSPRDS